jgi:hypothetical protein
MISERGVELQQSGDAKKAAADGRRQTAVRFYAAAAGDKLQPYEILALIVAGGDG